MKYESTGGGIVCGECGDAIHDEDGELLHENPDNDDHDPDPEPDLTEDWEDVDERLEANRARALGKRPAMDTRFGDDIDEDEEEQDLSASERRWLNKAASRYEVFHDKDPIRFAELRHDLPDKWVCVGDCLAVMYRTDKWKKFGNDVDYKHLHDKGEKKEYPLGKGVKIYEPASEATKSRVDGKEPHLTRNEQKLPVNKPEAITLLGYCLGMFVRRYDTGEIYEVNPRGTYLFSSPSGNMLTVYAPEKQPDGYAGFMCVMAGGKLRVLEGGIDG